MSTNLIMLPSLMSINKSTENKNWLQLKAEIDKLYLKFSSLNKEDTDLRIELLKEISEKERAIRKIGFHRIFAADNGYNYDSHIEILKNELSVIDYPSNQLNTKEILAIKADIEEINNRIARRQAIGLIPPIFNNELKERKTALTNATVMLGINDPEQKQILLLLHKIEKLKKQKTKKIPLGKKIENLLTY